MLRDPLLHPGVARFFNDLVAPAFNDFTMALAAEKAAGRTSETARRDARQATQALQRPYKIVRSILLGRYPGMDLPGTISEMPTDTDLSVALQFVMGVLHAERTSDWASELLAGEFGTQAPDAIAKINAAVDAKAAVMHAYTHRRETMDHAYTQFLAFKDAIRSTYGVTSSVYATIRGFRTASTPAVTPTPPVPVVAPTAAADAEAPSPTNGVSH